jgi:hypothetical protein
VTEEDFKEKVRRVLSKIQDVDTLVELINDFSEFRSKCDVANALDGQRIAAREKKRLQRSKVNSVPGQIGTVRDKDTVSLRVPDMAGQSGTVQDSPGQPEKIAQRAEKSISDPDLDLFSGSGSDPEKGSPPTPSRKRLATVDPGYSADFEAFWLAFPNKTGKGKAWESWKASKPPLERVLATIAWQIKSPDWTKEGGTFIPMPATWLNQRRWEDEPKRPLAAGPQYRVL